MGILRISNEDCLIRPTFVGQCLDYLRREHCAVIHSKKPERLYMVYDISGIDIPETGSFHLRVTELVPGAIIITIEK